MSKSVQGMLIGLTTALIGVMLTQSPGNDLTVIGHATVVQCNR
jgi:hypothetical protein